MIKAIYFNPVSDGVKLVLYSGLDISRPKRSYNVSDLQYSFLEKYAGKVFQTRNDGCLWALSMLTSENIESQSVKLS